MQRILILLLFLYLTVHVAGQNEEGTIAAEEPVESLYICECSDEKLLGKYNIDKSNLHDNVPVYQNDKERYFFRNKGFWYIGDLGPWPPETYFRCVDGTHCTLGFATPPLEGYIVNTKHKEISVPKISLEPCMANDEL